ncbi:MAG: AraC family transcriptional regulator [Planctomycetes bacterium]|nr:AraC family transcriptional regulator [Planctomycetota bacterium]
MSTTRTIARLRDIHLDEHHRIGSRTRETLVSPEDCPALGAFGIRLCGRSRALRGFSFSRLRPPIRQVLACESGTGEVLIGGEWIRLAPGQAYCTPNGAPHAYRASTATPWSLVWVTYEPDAHAWPAVLDQPVVLPIDTRPLSAAVDGLARELLSARDPAMFARWADLLHHHVHRGLARTAGDPRLAQLWEAVAADLGDPWTLGDLARRLSIGPEQLRRLCLAELGRTPMRHVAELRLARAATLLSATPLSVEEIANHVGYANAFAFSTAFRRRYAVPPARFRAGNR